MILPYLGVRRAILNISEQGTFVRLFACAWGRGEKGRKGGKEEREEEGKREERKGMSEEFRELIAVPPRYVRRPRRSAIREDRFCLRARARVCVCLCVRVCVRD